MPASHVPVFAPLPKSHYFLTVSYGTGMRTFAIRAAFVWSLACLLPVLGLTGAGATAYIVFHDDIVASLMARQTQMQYAYEDRLDALRGELQRQTVHDATDRAALDSRLGELLSRESKLETRAQLVANLADMSGLALGKTAEKTAELSANQAAGSSAQPPGTQNPLLRIPPPLAAPPAAALGYADLPSRPALPQAGKPHPEAESVPPETPAAPKPQTLSSIDAIGLPLPAKLSLASASLDKVERAQIAALVTIGSSARSEASRLAAVIGDVGLSSNRFHADMVQGEGGPFVPLPADRATPFGQALLTLQDSLGTAASLRNAVAHVPLADPLPGLPEVTSPFGARMDPFVGRPALHTGVDLRENYGTDVKATAGGRVVSAGPAGGYGNMVEIDHGNGLVTRYAHMEEILVGVGQRVEKNAIVGRVGATGRATGPHLHYEVRVDGEPVDPVRYINAGLRMGAPQTH